MKLQEVKHLEPYQHQEVQVDLVEVALLEVEDLAAAVVVEDKKQIHETC
jgi:hypothetical protein